MNNLMELIKTAHTRSDNKPSNTTGYFITILRKKKRKGPLAINEIKPEYHKKSTNLISSTISLSHIRSITPLASLLSLNDNSELIQISRSFFLFIIKLKLCTLQLTIY